MLIPYYCLASRSVSRKKLKQKEEMSTCTSGIMFHQVLSINCTEKYGVVTSNYYRIKKSKSGFSKIF